MKYSSSIVNDTWEGKATIPSSYFPPKVSKFNAYAIHGSGPSRKYEALFPSPEGSHSEPDLWVPVNIWCKLVCAVQSKLCTYVYMYNHFNIFDFMFRLCRPLLIKTKLQKISWHRLTHSLFFYQACFKIFTFPTSRI